jgi:hypothetical protein
MNKPLIFIYIPARVKTVHGIATLLTLEKDILEKLIIPLDNVSNSLSSCVFSS